MPHMEPRISMPHSHPLWACCARFRLTCIYVPVLVLLLPSSLHADGLIAFPGAVGQGAAASGGRGGDVYHVTTLEDYHPKNDTKIPGSLRHAIRSAEGPRTIVFDVGGLIALAAPLEILKSDLTIAGQTAPAPGITLWGYPVEVRRGSNVVIRYLRVRLGDFHARVDSSGKPHPYEGNGDLDPGSANAVHIGGGCERVIFDHVSTSWGMDETLSVTICRDVTVQHCIIASSLDDSFHPKGSHGYGTLVRGELTPADQEAGRGGFTFYGNLWAHHYARNPSIGGQQHLRSGQKEADRHRTDVNLVNNVIYNWRGQPTHRSLLGAVRINMIGNYYINGPEKDADRVFTEGTTGCTVVYQSGNCIDSDQDKLHNGRQITTPDQIDRTFREFGPGDEIITEGSGSPLPFIQSVAGNVLPAEESYEQVIQDAGCSLVRDAVDDHLVRSVEQRTGRLIDSQEQLRTADGTLEGIDDVQPERRPADFDTDGDGMPDAFETHHGLDPADPTDGNKSTLSPAGYTNLEVYLDEMTRPRE